MEEDLQCARSMGWRREIAKKRTPKSGSRPKDLQDKEKGDLGFQGDLWKEGNESGKVKGLHKWPQVFKLRVGSQIGRPKRSVYPSPNQTRRN